MWEGIIIVLIGAFWIIAMIKSDLEMGLKEGSKMDKGGFDNEMLSYFYAILAILIGIYMIFHALYT